jgi:hypothetical protein
MGMGRFAGRLTGALFALGVSMGGMTDRAEAFGGLAAGPNSTSSPFGLACVVEPYLVNPAQEVGIRMRADPPDGTIYTTGGTEFASGGGIDPWGPALTEPVLEAICGLTGVTILEQDGANGTYSSDDYIGIRFTGTRAGQTHEYEFAFSGASGTQYIETQTLSTQAPTIAAAFSPITITGAQTSTLTVTLTNPNSSTALSGVAVAEFSLPANLTASTMVTNCLNATGTYNFATQTLSMSGVTLAASTSCTITLPVTPGLAGTYPITTGAVSSTTPATTGLTASASLAVAAVAPGAPTIGTATAGDASASVAFTAPASSGGAAITGYTVTSSPGGLTGTGATSPVTVPGLTNGTAYTFTVQATNSEGSGAASAASNSVTPRPHRRSPLHLTERISLDRRLIWRHPPRLV